MSNNLKRTYEAMFLVDSAEATANWDEIIEAIKKVFERSEAEVITINKWDDRRLCYELEGRRRGTYILCYFKADPSTIVTIERDIQLTESLLRVLILSAEHMTEEEINAPTPAMKADSSESAPAGDADAVDTSDADTSDDSDDSDDSDSDDESEDDGVNILDD